jgi:ABC-type proline/glycine betaine transport system permease subunit
MADTSGGVEQQYFRDVGIPVPADVIKLGLQTKIVYNLNVAPATVLIGPNGRVEWVWVGVLTKDAMGSLRRILGK